MELKNPNPELLEATPLKSGNGAVVYRLRQMLVYDERLTNNSYIFGTVPKGWLTDLATIPRLLWRWFPPNGPWWQMAIVHDWLCLTASRTTADRIWGIMLEGLDLSRWQKLLLYAGPRLYGVMLPAWLIEWLERNLRSVQRDFLRNLEHARAA